MQQAEQLVANMSEALYLRLREAVETGRWPDGQPLTTQQKEDSLSLVMMYQAKNMDQTDPFAIGKNGQLIQKSKAQLRRERDQEITRFSISDSDGGQQADNDAPHSDVPKKDA